MSEGQIRALITFVDWPLIAAFSAGLLLASLIWAWRLRVRVATARTLTAAAADEQHQLERQLLEQRLVDAQRRHGEKADALSRLEVRLQVLNEQLAQQQDALAASTATIGEHQAEEAALKVRLEEAHKAFAEKEALFRKSGESLKQEFELLANRIFERQGEQNQARLATVLTPFKDQLSDFGKRVETVYTTETRDRASLLTEVRNLQKASDRINKEAENLTKALKGDVKTQGNWGELVLERVLEGSGLRLDHEYFLQQTRRDGEGSLKRPDVLIRLPDEKDVVVDAKLSLLAYEQALATEEEAVRLGALRAHVASLRAHVRRLAEQDYDQLDELRSLDFVLLFVPIEAAFSMAMEQDSKLFSEAFDRRVVIVSPTTLMMTLRIIHNVWRYEKQNRNAQEIARRAGALYDKLRGFVDDMENLGRQLQTAEKSYDAAFSKLSAGKGNLIRQVEQFRELGAPVKKPMPKTLVEEAAAEDQP